VRTGSAGWTYCDLRTNPAVVFVITELRINCQTQRKSANVAVRRSRLGAYKEDVFGGMRGETRGRLKTAWPVGGWGHAFFLQLLRCVTIKATIQKIVSNAPFSSIFNLLRYSLNTSHKSIPQCRNRRSRDMQAGLRGPQLVGHPPPPLSSTGTVSLKIHKLNSAHHSQGTQFEALKRVVAITQQYRHRDRYRRPPAVCIPTDKLSLQPLAPTIQLLLGTHESMRMEKI
jgi:hypothetical protein